MSGFKRRSNPAALTEQLNQLAGKKDFNDASEWKLSTDKLGNGSAVIRFLPAKGDDDTPFVKIFTHGFKHNGRWFVENCRTTIGQKCPVCEANSELWNSGIEENQKIVRDRKRKLSYWANIVVLKDESAPDNVGKVFKYRFGQKIMDKIIAAATPNEDLGTNGMDVTCVFEGANFLLKGKKVSGFPNYDDSTFGPQSELFGGDEAQLERVWNEMHDLKAIIGPSEFKSEDDIQKKYEQVVGTSSKTLNKTAVDDLMGDLDDLVDTKPAQQKSAPVSQPAQSVTETATDNDLDALLADLDLDIDM